MKRRTMLAGLGSTLAYYTVNAAEADKVPDHPEPEVSEAFYSPADVTVESIVLSADTLDAGTTLFTLISPELERRRSRLRTLAEAITLFERPLIDGNAQELVDALQGHIAATQARYTVAKRQFKTANSDNRSNRQALHIDAAAKASSKDAMTLATIKKTHAQKALFDARDIVKVAREYVKVEEELLKILQSVLVPVAPRKGFFKANVEQGSFQRKGRLLGSFVGA